MDVDEITIDTRGIGTWTVGYASSGSAGSTNYHFVPTKPRDVIPEGNDGRDDLLQRIKELEAENARLREQLGL